MPYVATFERHSIEKGSRDAFHEANSIALGAKFRTASKRLMPQVREIREIEEVRALYKTILVAKDTPGSP